ncbi:facilitated trehalose transporter Tret1-like [Contarinia nasturtii]|uniref:facilitated trehalose transporter Tret1-like n=1 Tax=Contarinia nasturtii TaxID=265458 RepID=UPI0012D443DB|nr:facilitated trehalose transporter Tret1-like [Contarinia nasturtii]
MLSGVFLSSIIVWVYGFLVLPNGYNSFSHSEFTPENKNLAYIPIIAIFLWSFCSFCGVNSMPWQLLSEVFPYKTRGAATGITAAINYVICFISTKTYYNLETTFSLSGVALFNSIVIAVGLVLMYKILPETENRSLEDIEMHFADNSKKFTDRKIPKISKQKRANANDPNEIPNKSVSVIDQIDIGCDNRGFVNDH